MRLMLINDSTRSVILGDGRQASAAVVVAVTAVATEKNYTIRCTRRTDEEKNLSLN